MHPSDVSLSPAPAAPPSHPPPSYPLRDASGNIIYCTSASSSRPPPRRACPLLHSLLCTLLLRRRHVGNMPVLLSRGGAPVVVVGSWFPFCALVTFPLVAGSVALVTAFLVVPYAPVWVYCLYLPLAAGVLLALCGVACSNPGLVEHRPDISDEAKRAGTHVWNDRVGSWRPKGSLYCGTNDVVVEKYDHFCPWTGTAIGRGNMFFFKAFVIGVNALCYVTVFVVVYLAVFERGKS